MASIVQPVPVTFEINGQTPDPWLSDGEYMLAGLRGIGTENGGASACLRVKRAAGGQTSPCHSGALSLNAKGKISEVGISEAGGGGVCEFDGAGMEIHAGDVVEGVGLTVAARGCLMAALLPLD